MKNNILIVGALLVIAVAVSVPVSAVIAGIMAWVKPETFSFWPTLGYAVLGCGMFNAAVSWRTFHKVVTCCPQNH